MSDDGFNDIEVFLGDVAGANVDFGSLTAFDEHAKEVAGILGIVYVIVGVGMVGGVAFFDRYVAFAGVDVVRKRSVCVVNNIEVAVVFEVDKTDYCRNYEDQK